MRNVGLVAVAMLCLSGTGAFAVSDAVKKACDSDYAAYCSDHKVGSEGLRSCMRSHRKMLTDACISALGTSDEVTKDDIEAYKRDKKTN